MIKALEMKYGMTEAEVNEVRAQAAEMTAKGYVEIAYGSGRVWITQEALAAKLAGIK